MIPMSKTDKSPSDHVVDHDCACKSALQSAGKVIVKIREFD